MLAVLAFGAGGGVVFSFTDNFDDGNDTGWTRYTPLSAFGAGGKYTFPGGAYRIEAPASPLPETLGPQRAGSIRADLSYTRSRIAVDITGWSTEMNQSLGLIARVSDVGLGTTKGYTFNYNSFSGYFQLNLVVDEAPARALEESVCKLNPTNSYRLVFTLVGDNVLGQAFASTNLSVPLHSVFGKDATYPTGTAGVFAYALAATGGLDARFDNYDSGAIAEPVRATLLYSTPRPDESPEKPIDAVGFRIADIETSVQSDTIRLEVDGVPVSPLTIEANAPVTFVTWSPPVPLDPARPHQAKASFADGKGTQAFEWGFGAPVAAPSASLLTASRVEGPYSVEASAVLDSVNRRFTVPVQGEVRFYRMRDSAARRLKSITVEGGRATVGYE